ncbi:MAG: 50S ribosomal protein L29 [Planctomycetota bacterium]
MTTKVSELRELGVADLNAEIKKAREKLFKFRFHSKNEDMQRAGDIRSLRRHIARVNTVLRERALKAADRKE